MSGKKRLIIPVIVIILLAVGFYRDFLFKSINALLSARDYEMSYSMPAHLQFFENLHYDTVVAIKWLLTLLFAGIYLLISLGAVRLFFQDRHFMKITLIVFMGLITVAGLISGIGYLFPGLSVKTYEVARYLMGIAQSPLVLMLLVPVFLLVRKSEDTSEKGSS